MSKKELNYMYDVISRVSYETFIKEFGFSPEEARESIDSFDLKGNIADNPEMYRHMSPEQICDCILGLR